MGQTLSSHIKLQLQNTSLQRAWLSHLRAYAPLGGESQKKKKKVEKYKYLVFSTVFPHHFIIYGFKFFPGGMFTKTEMSEVLTEICKIDPNFNKEAFIRLCEKEIIPNILEVTDNYIQS